MQSGAAGCDFARCVSVPTLILLRREMPSTSNRGRGMPWTLFVLPGSLNIFPDVSTSCARPLHECACGKRRQALSMLTQLNSW